MNSFGNRLYELRKSKGLSQEMLAEKLNVTRQTVSKWELGESAPDMDRLIALSTLFDVTMDTLVLGVEQKEEEAGAKTMASVLDEKVLTEANKKKAKSLTKILAAGFFVLLAADIISFIIYIIVNGGLPG